MIRLYIILGMLATFSPANTQVVTDPELSLKLEGLTNFNAIKKTVLDDYTEKLSALTPADSLERKKIMRSLKMWNRDFWISEYYVNEKGEIGNVNEINLQTYEAFKRTTRSASNRSQPINWISQGPTNVNFNLTHGEGIGRIDVIEFNPYNANIIYAGSAHGGLFKTVDGGANWASVSSFLPSLGISGIAIDPTNTDVIYVLTGDANSSGGCFNGGACTQLGEYISASQGVFKTYDGGINWFKTGPLGSGIYNGRKLIIDPSNPNILIAATSVGIFRTMDGGNTWANVSGGTANYWDIEFKPTDPGVVYAVGANTFNKSTNNGTAFTPITVMGLDSSTRISMAVTPANPNRVVLFAGKSVSGGGILVGIFSSDNSGDAFNLLYNDNNNNLFNNYIDINNTNSQVNYNNTIAISPANENIILVGGLCIWSTHDGGYHWTQETAYWAPSSILHDYAHPDTHFLVFDSNGTLYCGNDGGVYRGDPDGNEWNWPFINNGMNATQFYHFERQNDEDMLWGGAQDNGILAQNSGGTFDMYYGGDGYDEMTDRDYLVADGDNDDVYFSFNNSIRKDCAVGSCDISVPMNTNFFANLAMSPDLEDKIYAGYQTSTYISYNAGSDWTNMGNVPGNWCISTCPSNTNIFYAAGNNAGYAGGLRKWQSSGMWTDLTPALIAANYNSNLKITDIDVDPFDANKVYISVAGTTANAKVFRTLDGGSTWESLSPFELPNVPVFSVKKDFNDGVYAGTSIGVFYKRNNVNYWEYFSNGLPPVPVSEIELWFDTEVWISTFGRGIWNTSQYQSCQSNLTLAGDVQGNYFKEASNEITSSQLIKGGDGTYVKYNRGNRITLIPGFKATYGSRFKTYSSGCGGNID